MNIVTINRGPDYPVDFLNLDFLVHARASRRYGKDDPDDQGPWVPCLELHFAAPQSAESLGGINATAGSYPITYFGPTADALTLYLGTVARREIAP